MSTSRRGFLGSLLLAPFFGKLLPARPAPSQYQGEFKWLHLVDESKAVPAEVGYYFARYECFPAPIADANGFVWVRGERPLRIQLGPKRSHPA